MNKLLILALCTAAAGISGCTRYVYVDAQETQPEMYAAEEVVVENVSPEICQTAPNNSLCAGDPFVNYTRTAADYRAYGERTPRGHMISQAAAGNNIAASIPPSIDNEVIEYEEQISVIADTNEGAQNEIPNEVNDITVEDKVNVEAEQTEANQEAVDEDPVQDWVAEEGQSLKGLLTQWSEQSGWRLVWNTNRNYVLNAGAMFRGRFADVSSALIRAFARARPAPIATFYKGNRVLVVETMEDENAYE